jgi:hypothetical protein
MFEVSAGDKTTEYPSRAEAILAARGISAEQRGVVNIVARDGRERMTYQGGILITYDYETRKN